VTTSPDSTNLKSLPISGAAQPTARSFEDLGLRLGDAIVDERDIKQVKEIIADYNDCFALSNSELTGCKLAECSFTLKDPNSRPVRSRSFPMSAVDRMEFEKQVKQMEIDGLIQRSLSPYSSPVLLVTKHNGSKRVVVDMRTINSLLKDEVFPTITMREIAERVGESKAKVFSLIDLRAAYNQIIIHEDSRKYTAFNCGPISYEFKRLPFGLKLSGNFFNYLVSQAIQGDDYLATFCITYIDDIFLFTTTVAMHIEVMKRLFIALRKAGLKIHNEKCELFKTRVKFIGHIFSEKGVEPEQSKIEAMQSYPRPINKKALRSWIGLVSYYRNFIQGLSNDLVPLLDMLAKDAKFVWNDEAETAFQSVKSKLTNLPVLTYPDESKDAGEFIVQTDASMHSIAGMIMQKSKDGLSENLIACYGRKLRPNERNWDSNQKEVLALVICIMKFRHLVVGRKLIIRSDNLSVKYFTKLKNESAPRLIRWSVYLSDILCNAVFEHVKGSLNSVPDALSRRVYSEEEDMPSSRELDIVHDDFSVNAILSNTLPLDEIVEYWLNEQEQEQKQEQEIVQYWLRKEKLGGTRNPFNSYMDDGATSTDEEDEIYTPTTKMCTIQRNNEGEITDYIVDYKKSIAANENHAMPGRCDDPLVKHKLLEQMSSTAHALNNPRLIAAVNLNAGASCFIPSAQRQPQDALGPPIECRLQWEAFPDHICELCNGHDYDETEVRTLPEGANSNKPVRTIQSSPPLDKPIPRVCAKARAKYGDHTCSACATIDVDEDADTVIPQPVEANREHAEPEAMRIVRAIAKPPIECRLQMIAFPDHTCPLCSASVNAVTSERPLADHSSDTAAVIPNIGDEDDDGEEYEDDPTAISNTDNTMLAPDAPLTVATGPISSDAVTVPTPNILVDITGDTDIQADIYELTRSFDTDLKLLQGKCEALKPLITFLKTGDLPPGNDKMSRRILLESEYHFLDENGILCSHKPNSNKKTQTIRDTTECKIIPVSLQAELLNCIHRFGHPGIGRTLAILESSQYKWTGMYSDVKKHVLACQTCAVSKRGLYTNKSKIVGVESPTRCGEILCADVLGPLEVTASGNRYVISIMDQMSSFIWLFPVKEQTTETVARCFLTVISTIGLPRCVRTDLGSVFVNKVMTNLWKMLGVKHVNTMAYNHKALPIERIHRTIGDTLRTLLKSSEIFKWDENLPLVEMILRSSATADRPLSPSEILYGTPMRTPTQAAMEEFAKEPGLEITDYVENLKNRLSRLLTAQQKIIETNKQSSVKKYNKNTRPTVYKEGELVYLRNDGTKIGECTKFRKEYLGPYRVVRLLSDHSLKLLNTKNDKVLKNPIHIDRVKHAGCSSTKSDSPLTAPAASDATPADVTPAVRVKRAKPTPLPRATDKNLVEDVRMNAQKWYAEDSQETNDVFEIVKLLKTRGSGKNKQYLVQWAPINGEKFPHQWIMQDNITKNALDEYHLTHTLDGKIRSTFKNKKKR
jgi:RNase H-like domain found in reverse transcriptase/Reverse transcriptase (RNA-dependent DNA polymerase)/Integrase zinc binding domain/Integrase core domain